ncbi:MAG: glycine cleavage system aminomethyltransferase GcvT [Verrucomicrobiota bacterium]|nr:glycine cleavage system aminomethyltransferase GcvT [Verrucomicrobiota bacterium]
MLKRTPLFSTHQKLGAKLIDFGGWEMPVQYTSITDEHLAVRNAAGIFDISHMGEVSISGAAAAGFLNHVLTNDIRKLAVGQGQYTLMCNENSGVIDDLYAYRIATEVFLLIVNASRIEADVSWLQKQGAIFPQKDQLEIGDASENYAAVAVQGPRVKEFIDDCLPGVSTSGTPVKCVTELKKNEIGIFYFGGTKILVSNTGYTGEDGFEITGLSHSIQTVWDTVLNLGQPFGCKPAGLGARDTLRTEVCYPLYGHELNEETSPVEAGLGFFVALDKGNFIGRATLAVQKEKGVGKKMIAFRMVQKSAPPRPHYSIWSVGREAKKIGDVTSGTQSPSLGLGIGLGYVPPEFAQPETKIEIEIRGQRSPAIIVKKPFYRKAS